MLNIGSTRLAEFVALSLLIKVSLAAEG